MNAEELLKYLENRVNALEAKRRVSLEKGNLDLFLVFEKEYTETEATLKTVKEALKSYDPDRFVEKKQTFFSKLISKFKRR